MLVKLKHSHEFMRLCETKLEFVLFRALHSWNVLRISQAFVSSLEFVQRPGGNMQIGHCIWNTAVRIIFREG